MWGKILYLEPLVVQDHQIQHVQYEHSWNPLKPTKIVSVIHLHESLVKQIK